MTGSNAPDFTHNRAPAGAVGNALPVGPSPGNVIGDGFAVHVFEV
jgi:hypothetical protein